MPNKGRKLKQWTPEDDLILESHYGKPVPEVAKLMGVSASAVWANRRRLKLVHETETKVKAQAALEARKLPTTTAGPVFMDPEPRIQEELIPAFTAPSKLIQAVPPTPVLSEKVKELLLSLARDNNQALEDMQVVMDCLVDIRLKYRSIGAQVKMLQDNLGLNKKG